MAASPAPRWIFAVAASFVLYWAMLVWGVAYPPVGVGVGFNVRRDGVFATRVVPGFGGARAGIRNGDRIVEANGFVLRDTPTLRVMLANAPVGAPQTWRLDRGGVIMDVVTAPTEREWFGSRRFRDFAFVLVFVMLGVSLALGVLIAVKRPRDPSALQTAWLLASIGCLTAPLWPTSFAHMWRALPAPLGWLPWPACVSSAFVAVQLYALFARFPRKAMRTSVLIVTLVPGVLVALYLAVFIVLIVYAPYRAAAMPAPRWLQLIGPLAYPAYMAAAVLLLWRQRRLAADVTDRRRVRLLLAATASAAGGLLLVALPLWANLVDLDVPAIVDVVMSLGGALLLLALPFSFAYVVLRDRLFDVRVIVRLGLQYALARGAVRSLAPLVAVLLVGDVLLHGDTPINDVLARRGWMYAVLGGAAALVVVRREAWLAALDRRFFREKYAAQRVLSEVVEQARRAGSVQSAASTVVERIDAALHPTHAAILIRPVGAAAFTACAAASVPPLAADSAIVKLLRALGRPLTLSPGERSGLSAQLPDEARAWLRAAGVELLVPITVGSDTESILVLGPKRSEDPFSGEDLDLLSAIASSLSLVGTTNAPAAAARPAPRSLGRRYELRGLLGSGGMGAVYEAHDVELDRLVAIKVIREDVIGRTDAADRFRREARAAASFTHPNVATVYDFGIADGSPYLVMERLVGQTLRQRLNAVQRLPGSETVGILRGAAAALDAAHRASLIHRDLKPENIFLSESDGMTKLLDFGVAKLFVANVATETATASGVLVGTMVYMAPEQIGGGLPSPAWDVWALNVTAYESIAGAHPFAGGASLTAAPAILAGRWTPIAQHMPEASSALEQCFARAFALDPAARPRTASAAIEMLAAAVERG